MPGRLHFEPNLERWERQSESSCLWSRCTIHRRDKKFQNVPLTHTPARSIPHQIDYHKRLGTPPERRLNERAIEKGK